MSALNKLLAGTAGLAVMIGLAGPAAAQYYPNYNYPGYAAPGYGYGNNVGNNVGNAVGQAINGVIAATQYGNYPYGNYGYGQTYGYGMNSNGAVDRCARAVEGRLNGYNGYGDSRYNGGRVTGITRVDPRGNGGLRVWGVASTYSGYGYGQPNMSWDCSIDRFGRVTDTNFNTNRWGYNRGW